MNNMELQNTRNRNEKEFSKSASSPSSLVKSAQLLHFRCPTCTKLYEVSAHLIKSTSPHFDCLVCGEIFSFNHPPANFSQISTFRVETRSEASQENHKACPKCAALNSNSATECYSCQIIFRNYELLKQENYSGALPSLVGQWQEYLLDYENVLTQKKFISSCRAANQLSYAEAKFNSLKKVMGESDPYCANALEEIETIRQQMARIKNQAQAAFNWNDFFVKSRGQIFEFLKQRRVKYCAPVLFAFVLIGLGILGHDQRNMVGPGVAILILHFGLIYTFKGRIDWSDFLKK